MDIIAPKYPPPNTPKKDALNLPDNLLIGVAMRSLEGFFKCFKKTNTTP